MKLFKLPAKDRQDHIVYSFAICITLTLFLSFLTSAPVIAFLVTLAIGLYKEIRDRYDDNPSTTPDKRDFDSDVIGAILAVVVFVVAKYFIN
jgi:hypothetical protein